MKLIKIAAIVLFLASVPWAIDYNLRYDRFGALDRPNPPVLIQIVTVDAGLLNNTLKQKGAEYVRRNMGVRIFVLPMTLEQIGTQEFDVRIIKDNGNFHCFISPAQTKYALEICQEFLGEIVQENENFKIHI